MKLFIGVFMISIVQMNVFAQTETYDIELAPFSTKYYDEFCPVYYNNGIVFCANWKNTGILSYSTSENKGPVKIYYIDTSEIEKNRNVRIFSKELETNFNDGPISFSQNRNLAYFSRNIEVGKRFRDATNLRNKLGIFNTEYNDGKWSKILEFRFNNEYYNTTTPCLSPDGNRLYFASDKPGGFGGYDLYYCKRKSDYWSDPVNLGPIINTKGNEAYPFINDRGELFYSSDGLQGLGGKDIYFSKFVDSAWLTPVPLDPPINSKYDDFGICTDNNLDAGYFSSNRGGSADIYHFKSNFPQILYCDTQLNNQYCYSFIDDEQILINESYLKIEWEFGDGTKASGSSVQHCYKNPGTFPVKLNIVEKKSDKLFFTKLFKYQIIKEIEKPIITCPDAVIKNGFIELNGQKSHFSHFKILGYSWDLGDGTRDVGNEVIHTYKTAGIYNIKLILSLYQAQTGMKSEVCVSKNIGVFNDPSEKAAYISNQTKNALKNSFLQNTNPNSQLIKYSVTKELKEDAVFQLEVIASKKKISLNNSIFKKIPKKYFLKEVFQPEDSTYSYIVDEEPLLMELYPSFLELLSLGFENSRVRTYILKNAAEKELYNLKKVFGIFSDVYFEENEYTASPSAYPILDQIVEIMNNHPEIKLEIAGNADDPGSSVYNMELSEKRAQAMANYLTSRGIRRDRLIPKGFGTSKPIAPSHSEEDRKINRRVQFIIINE